MTVTKIEHGQTYRFLNISDNRFLDLYMKNTENGTQMFIYDGNTCNAQRFRAEVKEDVFSSCRFVAGRVNLVASFRSRRMGRAW